MRDIRFKAKRLDNSEWVEGDLLHNDGKVYIYGSYIDESEAYIEKMQVDPPTVCQFTGLTDNDGKEIWEHDNICVILAYVLEGEVIYDDEHLCFKIKPNEESSKYYQRCITFKEIEEMASYEDPADIEVISSKFDRKEGEK